MTQSLLTVDGTEYSTDKLSDALKAIEGDIGINNFILYVHGRGKEPTKSLAHVIPQLEREYKAKVLMFHWSPSWSGVFGYPNNEAKAASTALFKILKDFKVYKSAGFEGGKSTFLVHSMGNIVLANMMNSYVSEELEENLFDTIILNSADADADVHHEWVEKIDFTPKLGDRRNIYITVNEHDVILRLSAKRQVKKRLGQKLQSMLGRYFSLAKNANYLDVTECEVNHRYFIKSGQKNNPYLQQFYGSVLNGIPIDLNGWAGIYKKRPGNGNFIYELKAK